MLIRCLIARRTALGVLNRLVHGVLVPSSHPNLECGHPTAWWVWARYFWRRARLHAAPSSARSPPPTHQVEAPDGRPEHVPCSQRRLDGRLTVVAGHVAAESTPSKLERLERQLNDTEVRLHTLGFSSDADEGPHVRVLEMSCCTRPMIEGGVWAVCTHGRKRDPTPAAAAGC